VVSGRHVVERIMVGRVLKQCRSVGQRSSTPRVDDTISVIHSRRSVPRSHGEGSDPKSRDRLSAVENGWEVSS
jgi:hypothetical protein